MNIAFDCYKYKLVRADRIDDSSKTQPFRFVCPICGQTVRPAAKDSTEKSTHFRHLHGNNATVCEKYLGTHGFNGLKNKIKALHKKNIDFYFSKARKRLYIGVNFSKEEIEKYQDSNAELTISSSTKDPPFLIKKINKIHFAADLCEKIDLVRYSEQYSISINNEHLLLNSSVLNRSIPSFFKASETNNEMSSKFVKSDTIYTNTSYIILLSSCNKVEVELRKYNSVIIIESFDFKIDKNGERIFGVEVCFKELSDEIKRLLRTWGKNIEKQEQLDLLWPPVFEIEDCFYSNSSEIILRSSFKIEENNNTNIKAQNIKHNNDLYKITDYNKGNISCKNIDITFKHIKCNADTDVNIPNESYVKRFKVPNKNCFYLFSENGIEKLSEGQIVYLTPNSYVCEYLKNYHIKTIKYDKEKIINCEELLIDILANYKLQIPYKFEFSDEIPRYMREYLNVCEKTGWINAIVARYIEEGKFWTTYQS